MFLGDISPAARGYIPERKKLTLKPRSAVRADQARRRSTSSQGDPFGNPFGAARPREEVLKARGFDVKAFDSKIEKKAAGATFTRDQAAKLDAIRSELTAAESRFREANEMELPEEAFRVQVEIKRKELNELVDSFSGLSTKECSPRGGGGGSRFNLSNTFAPVTQICETDYW